MRPIFRTITTSCGLAQMAMLLGKYSNQDDLGNEVGSASGYLKTFSVQVLYQSSTPYHYKSLRMCTQNEVLKIVKTSHKLP